MRRRRLACAIIAFTSGIFLVPSNPADAVTCPAYSQANLDQFGDVWTPNDGDIGGVRAAVVFRPSGMVCQDGTPLSQVSYWIGAEDSTSIAQIGFSKTWDIISGITEYCKFYAIGDGSTFHLYGCGSQVDGDATLFKVEKYRDTSTATYRYEIDDCGLQSSSTYSNCTVKNGQQTLGTGAGVKGDGVAESLFGGSPCTNKVMGSPSYRAVIGTSSHPWQIQNDYLGNYAIPTAYFTPQPKCAHYFLDFITNGIIKTWDDRN